MKKTMIMLACALALAGCKDTEDEEKGEQSEIFLNCPVEVRNNQTFSVNVSSTSNEISSVELFIDGKSYENKSTSPYSFDVTLKDFQTGEHEMMARAILDDGSIISSETSMFKFTVSLGDDYQGGIIIQLSEDGLHGTIAAKHDIDGGISNSGLYKYGAINGGYEAYDMDDGFANTMKFEGKTDFDYAAAACLELELNGYDDWYLPAFNQLKAFEDYRESLNLPERTGNTYWSSTGDTDPSKAYAFSFGATIGNPCHVTQTFYVRPCRNF